MITYIDKSNATKYTALFDKATALLKERGDLKQNDPRIMGLEQYFAWLPTLMSYEKTAPDGPKIPIGLQYAILPVDEEVFEINANTRQITIPENFRKNGIAVQGDQVAEVVYFKIARYFDFMDLSNTICVVEYKVLRENKEVPYIYVAPFLDTQRHAAENKMIFPWVISGVAARQDGIVEYAIRFYRLEGLTSDDSKIVYDLHTLPAKSTILAGLNVNEEDIQYEYDYDASYKDYLAKQIADNITYWHTLE